MNLVNILKEDIFKIPAKPNSKYLPKYLKDKYLIYLNKLRQISQISQAIDDSEIKIQEEFCDGILDSLKLWLQGLPSKAFNRFCQNLSLIESYIYYSEIPQYLFKDANNLVPVVLYRARPIEQNTYRYLKKQLFHIPFEKRHKITTKRYSIPGLPCLYLSNNPYLCWKELGLPLNDLVFARLEINDTQYSLVDLTLSSDVIISILETAKKYDLKEKELSIICGSFLKRWPLILSCSIPSNNKDNFKVQYTIPQLLMEWIKTKNKALGVMYPSTKYLNAYNPIRSAHINYAIPVREIKEEGHCPVLSKSFEITEPMIISSSKFANRDELTQDYIYDKTILKDRNKFNDFNERLFETINPTGKSEIEYGRSIFMEIEIDLLKRPVSSIH